MSTLLLYFLDGVKRIARQLQTWFMDFWQVQDSPNGGNDPSVRDIFRSG
jgi:hypothetical protein